VKEIEERKKKGKVGDRRKGERRGRGHLSLFWAKMGVTSPILMGLRGTFISLNSWEKV
jgi:hypothetical protein